jgi:homoserine kinase type II
LGAYVSTVSAKSERVAGYGPSVGIADEDDRLGCSDALTDEIGRVVNIPQTMVWRDLGGSWATNLLAVGPGGGWGTVFRVHRLSTTAARLHAEQETRRVLASAGIPTVQPLAVFDGDEVGQLRTGHLIEAERFVASDAQMNSPDLLIRGFSMLGAIHRCLRRSELPAAAYTVTHANHVSAHRALAATTAGAQRIRRWAEPALTRYADAVVEHIGRVSAAEEQLEQRCQVIHGDFWDNNVLFTGSRVAAVLDFGFMAERARVDDLALPIWFYLLEPGHGPPNVDDAEVVAAMLDAYDRAGEPLSREERLAVPLAIARQPAWSVGHWVLQLDEQRAINHAREAAREMPVAQAILRELNDWQRTLTQHIP